MSMSSIPHRSLLAFAVSAALVAGLGACDRASTSSGDAAKPAGQASAPTKPALGTFGFDTAGMDKSVAPGDDFYVYADGGWT